MRSFLQLAFDLFDAAPVSAPAAPAPELHGPFQPAQTIASVMAPAQFSHPRANRQTCLCDAQVAYEFKRGKRRTIGMQVGPDGLVVSAPRWVPLYEVEAALQEKASWIVRKLDEMRVRQQRLDSTRIEWCDGSSFPFLGEMVIVVLHTDAQAPNLTLDGVPRMTLHIGLPQHATAAQIRDAVQAWLMRQAHRVFTERLDHFAPQLGVRWRRLSLSSAGTRWGSATSDGVIRLNWRLVHFRRNVIDYVVAHELSHLRVMDHSPRFWDTVRSVVPDFQTLRGELRDEALPRWH